MPEIIHITAHLGGGVGKVLSHLAEASERCHDGIRHTLVCLEAPEKSQFVDYARAHGCEVLICPNPKTLSELAADADIVQLEWWHHPVVAAWLGAAELPAMRLIVWSHISGLYVPSLPKEFVCTPDRFLFTSPCTGRHPRLQPLSDQERQRIDTVFSSGGFADFPAPPSRVPHEPLRVGYVGTLNFAKLHPRLLDYLAAVDLPDFRLRLVGDPTTGAELLMEAVRRGLDDRLELCGYRSDIAAELANFDVLAYLLNPLHYGTTENALLEAMAMGVVPVVLDNPAETQIVRNKATGLVVDGPAAFAQAIDWLSTDGDQRQQLGEAAACDVRTRFSADRTARQLAGHYRSVLDQPKRRRDFRSTFGETPADWFKSCLGDEAWRFHDDGSVDLSGEPPHCLFERSKSSVFHYQRTFPADPRLHAWAQSMEARH